MLIKWIYFIIFHDTEGVGPGCTDKTLLSAIASALHTSAAPITGQLSAAVEKNPGVWLNTAQPLCKAFIVTDEDIRYFSPLNDALYHCGEIHAGTMTQLNFMLTESKRSWCTACESDWRRLWWPTCWLTWRKRLVRVTHSNRRGIAMMINRKYSKGKQTVGEKW